MSSHFDELQGKLAAGGPAEVLETLADVLKQEKKYHELFEVRKMQVRLRLGLSPLYSSETEQLDETTRDQLETGMLAACREVGRLLLAKGNAREGWMYFRPVGDRAEAARLLADIEAHEDNIDELVEICLHEGVDPPRGFALVLEHYGTCNSITAFDQAVSRCSRSDQQAAAELLVRHLHEELLATVKADIAQQEGTDPQETLLAELFADRPWLFGEHAYHIDTTHLASTVRFARLLSDPKALKLAIDLTEYGRRLNKQFQYPGEEPFPETYPHHSLYFRALLGEDVDAAVAHFKERAETVEPQQQGTAAVELYLDLLARLGRPRQALSEALRLMPRAQPVAAPNWFELSREADDFEPVLNHCRQQNDLLGFATALVCSQANK